MAGNWDEPQGRAGSMQRVVSLSGYAVPDDAKRELVDIWLDRQGNVERQILEAFKLGFNTGATAQANDKLSDGPANNPKHERSNTTTTN